MITLSFDRRQLGVARAALERLSKAVWDLWTTMDAIGAYLVSSTQKRFQTQTGPDGQAWPPSLRARIQGGLTLLDHGSLRSSITHVAGRDTVEVGTNRIYAAIHQLGGVIKARNVPHLRFRLANGRWISKPSVTIPARPFLGLDKRDEEEIDAIVQADLEAAIGGGESVSNYYPFPALELAMIDRVKQASLADAAGQPAGTPLLGYRLRQVESYQGQLNGGPKRVAELVREVPAVWICFEDASNDGGLWTGKFIAVCVQRNARSDRATRHGAGGDVGVYQVAKDVAGLLDRQTFGLGDIAACRITGFDLVYDAAFEATRAAIMLVSLQAQWDGDAADSVTLPGEVRAPGLFATFNVDWDIPVFTTPPPAIPVDDASKRDARDVIHPDQE